MRPSFVILAAAALLVSPRLWAQERHVLQERSVGAVLGMRYSPDGSRLAVNFQADATVRVYPAAGGRPVVIPAAHDNQFVPWFTADGHALVCRTADASVKVYDPVTGKELRALVVQGHSNAVLASPDHRTLAVTTSDGGLRLYDLATLRERCVPQREAAPSASPSVTALAFSPDSSLLVTLHRDDRLRSWDTTSGRPIGDPLVSAPGAYGLVVSPDGRHVLTCFLDQPCVVWDRKAGRSVALQESSGRDFLQPRFSADGATVYADTTARWQRSWDAGTGRLLSPAAAAGPGTNAPAMVLAAAADGKYVAAALADGKLLVWDVARPKEARHLDGEAPGVKDLRFSPDGKVLAAGCFDGVTRLWDPATGKLLRELRHHTNYIARLQFAPDGKVLMVEGSDNAGSLWHADPAAANFGKLLAHLPELGATVEPSVEAWAPDGKTLAVRHTNEIPRTINGATGDVLRTLPARDARVVQMAFAADNRTLLVRTETGRLSALDALDGKEVALPAEFTKPTAFAASADGWLAIAGEDGAWLWPGPSGKATRLDAPRRPGGLAFSPDGRFLAAAGTSVRLWRRDKDAWVEAVAPDRLPNGPGAGPWSDVALAAGGRALLLTGPNHELTYLDVETGRGGVVAPPDAAAPTALLVAGEPPLALVRSRAGTVTLGSPPGSMTRIHTPARHVLASVLAPDGHTTVSASSDGLVRWHPDGDRTKAGRTLDVRAESVVRLALSSDGKQLLAAGRSGQVTLWDVGRDAKSVLTRSLPGLQAAEWAPDGKHLAVGTVSGDVEVWSVPGGESLSLERGTAHLTSLSLSRDGRTLAVVDARHTVRVSDTVTGELLVSLANRSAAALSPDGRRLASTDNDGVVHLDDVRAGSGHTTVPGMSAMPTQALTFSPDGRTLSIRCRDGSCRHWDLTAGSAGAKFPWCSPLLFSGDGRRCVGVTNTGTLTVWDAATGAEVARWPGFYNGPVSTSADGKLVVQAVAGVGVRLFDTATGGEPTTLFKGSTFLAGVLLTPDGKTVVGLSLNHLFFWDVTRGAERPPVPLSNTYFTPGGVSLCEDGSSLVTPLQSGGFKVWDVKTGRERASLGAPPGQPYPAQFALSADASTLVAAYGDQSLRVFDLKTAPERGALSGHAGPVHALALSADGRLVATAGEDHAVRLFDPTAPGRPPLVLRGSPAAALGVAVSPDGRTVAGTAADGSVRVWPRDARADLLTLRGHTGWSYRVQYLPDGKHALSSGGDGLRLWDLEKGGVIRDFAPGRASFGMGLSPDGKRCLSNGAGGVRVYDLDTGKELREFRGHTGYVWVALYLPGGKEVLTAGSEGTMIVWDPETGEKKRQFPPTGDWARCAALSPDGKRLATGNVKANPTRATVRIWDLDGRAPPRTFGDYAAEISAVSWSPDGKWLLVADFDKTIRIWDADTGKERVRMTQPTAVDGAAWLPDGRRVISTAGDGDSWVRLWDAESGKELRRFGGHTLAPITVAVAPDGHTALTTSKDSTVRQWNLGWLEPAVLTGHEGEVWSAAFAPDGKLLATAGADRTVRLWDVSGDLERPGYGRLVRVLRGAADNLFCVAFAPDGRRLAAGEGDLFVARPGAVRVWDVGSGELLLTLKGHSGAVRAVAYSPDGKLLATGSTDRTVRLWDAREGQFRLELKGHTTSVMGLSFDASGGLLASAGGNPLRPRESGEVLLWEVPGGRRRGPLVGHAAGLTAVALSRDGTILFGAGYDDTVRIWSLPRPSP